MEYYEGYTLQCPQRLIRIINTYIHAVVEKLKVTDGKVSCLMLRLAYSSVTFCRHCSLIVSSSKRKCNDTKT